MGFLKNILGKKDMEQGGMSDDIPPPPNLDVDIPPPPDFNTGSEPEIPPADVAPMPVEPAPFDPEPEPEMPAPEPEPEQPAAPVEPAQPTAPEPVVEETPQEPPAESIMFEKQYDVEEEIEDKRRRIAEQDEPLFAKVEDYKDILGSTDHIKSSLKDCEEILKRLNEIKLEEDKEYEKWKNMLLDIYRKMSYIDRLCFEEE